MEKAIFISSIRSPKESLHNKPNGYKYIYYGHEFCENLIPSIEEIKALCDISLSMNTKLVLVTPYTTDNGLGRIEDIVGNMLQNNLDFEVVFNDWGVFQLCKEMGVSELVMGRLLNKMKRDFRIVPYKYNFSEELYEYLRTPGCFSEAFYNMLTQSNIKRIEFDNVLQGIALNEKLPQNLKMSLYYPFMYLTTSRTCENNKRYHNGLAYEGQRCDKSCGNKVMKLRLNSDFEEIYFAGRTFFIKNEAIGERYTDFFDRIIILEELPY